MFPSLVTAVRTLTIFPFPGRETKNHALSLYWFSLVGGGIGLCLYLSSIGLQAIISPSWPEFQAIFLLLLSVFITRGLHLDGLADWADGFWGGFTRERTLEIMKDSFIGVYGVMAIVGISLLKWIALVGLIQTDQIIWVIVAAVGSRAIQVELAASTPYARNQGRAQGFIGHGNIKRRIVSLSIALGLAFTATGFWGIIALCGAIVFCKIFAFWCLRRVGGMTGDLLGACSEITEVLLFLFPPLLYRFL